MTDITEWIRTTTLQALHDDLGHLLDSGMPGESTVTTREDDGEPDRIGIARPKPTTVDLLRQVAERAPYRTERPDDQVGALPADGGPPVLLTTAQHVAALNAAPLLLRVIDVLNGAYDGAHAGSPIDLIENVVRELRGDR